MKTVIGIDAATNTGIALGQPGGSPLAWSESMGDRGSTHDVRFAQMLKTTARLIREHEPVLIAVEQPIKSKHDKTGTNEILMGLTACIRGLAYDRRVPVIMVPIQKIDRHFFGFAGLKSADRKAAIVKQCRLLKWRAPDQDAADACAIWSYACSTLSRSHSLQTTPLFQNV